MRNLLDHFDRLSASSIVRLPATLMIALITAYRHTLSPDHGPLKALWRYGYCRHSPTCSTYAIEKIHERGALIGGLLALKRVLSCNPFKKPSAEQMMRASHDNSKL